MKRLVFCVTNDLAYDQRMQRICHSLASVGYDVTLVGRMLPASPPVSNERYRQKRIRCFFNSGFLFYAEFNIRLLFFLLVTPAQLLCAIDLDTILPVYIVSLFKRTKRVYDAHEWFTQQKEIVTRQSIYKCWMSIEKFMVPRFRLGYTVNKFIASVFREKYGVNYAVVRNLPWFSVPEEVNESEPFIIYQGAVNEGRGFETLIPAMKEVSLPLHIYGDGNFVSQVRELIAAHDLGHKVILKGKRTPDVLRKTTPLARAAVMIFEAAGLNQYQSLSNRFFDYIMAGVPQICVDYPAYKELNDRYEIACMIPEASVNAIAKGINSLLHNKSYYEQLKRNCVIARCELNWQQEEKILLSFYERILCN